MKVLEHLLAIPHTCCSQISLISTFTRAQSTWILYRLTVIYLARYREGHCCLVFELNFSFTLHQIPQWQFEIFVGFFFFSFFLEEGLGKGARVNFHWPRNKSRAAERINVLFGDSHPILQWNWTFSHRPVCEILIWNWYNYQDFRLFWNSIH